jgi:3-oxoacyl-[acyl-carrier protein] reductase
MSRPFSPRYLKKTGPAEVLVGAAGLLRLRPDGTRQPLAETSLADWEDHHAVNARGTFLCLRAYLRQWQGGVKPRAGRVVTFASVAAQLGGYRSSAAYIGSKGSVLALTKAAAREAAPLGITVNALAPGLIDAPMLRLSLAPGAEAQAAAAIPLGRIGTPADVAGAVSFLVSEDAAYMTGGVLDVNGGYRMQ